METWNAVRLPFTVHLPFVKIRIEKRAKELILEFLPSKSNALGARVIFQNVVAFKWSDDCFDSISEATPQKIPKLDEGGSGAYPLVEAITSDWINSFGEAQRLTFQYCKHFKLFSEGDTYDVLTTSVPVLETVKS